MGNPLGIGQKKIAAVAGRYKPAKDNPSGLEIQAYDAIKYML